MRPRPKLREAFGHIPLASNMGASCCTMSALRKHCTSWSRTGATWRTNVRAAITKLVRSSGEPSVSDRSPAAACSAKPIVAGYDNYVWCPLNPGHQVWVYCQMTGKRNVMPRLKEILSREGLKVGVMRADDVEPKEREEWISKHGREYDVMICFPKLVSTGLDLFSKVQGGHNYNCIVFYETGYKLNEMRQAARRAWRIGQPRDCYIYYMYYQGTMQHRAMSLMSKKMAAALALEGEFSEEGLAAMAGEGDQQMALAKSMSEKIDDDDMQRSWSKVKSLTEKKKPPKKRSIPTLADMAADAKPDALDTLEAEAQLLARTILERQKKPVPASAMPDIISLSERMAQADEGMWGAARSMAFREEPAPVEVEAAKVEEWMAAVAKAEPLVGTFTVTDGNGTVLAEMTNPISVVGVTIRSRSTQPWRSMAASRPCWVRSSRFTCPNRRRRFTLSSTTSSSMMP